MEKSKIKIAIMTFYAVQNYGAALQAFALQHSILKSGVDVEMLKYFDAHNEGANYVAKKQSSVFKKIKMLIKIVRYLPRHIRIKKYAKNNSIGFDSFKTDFMRISKEPYYDYDDLKEANGRYNGFITGSDMVWTPIGQNLDAYFLQFADKNKRFSYAPSMTGCDSFSESNAKKIRDYLSEMTSISCREREGVDYVKRTTGRDAILTLDPTLLLKKEEWCDALSITINKSSKPYILCYVFDGLSCSFKTQVNKLSKLLGMDVRFVPMLPEELDHEIKSENFGPCGPKQFVDLFMNASFIVTNTFHGFLFSLIAEKPFVVLRRENNNKWKANETRISDLMDILDIKNRYLETGDTINNDHLTLDYCDIKEKLDKQRQDSLSYLNSIINQIRSIAIKPEPKISNIRDLSIKKCTGCTSCVQVCPFDAIKITVNEEGFITPMVDTNNCKECGKCAKLCPSINSISRRSPIDTKVCVSKDESVDASASGGVFITVAKYIISQLNGIVFGAVLDDYFICKHIEANNVEELRPMQNSKYIQSNIGSTYKRVKELLDLDKYVLFTGTPCQIAGLLSFLQKPYEKLLTMDVVCHGVPSPLFWKTYIQEDKNNRNINSYSFRNRSNRRIGKTTYQIIRKRPNVITYIDWNKDPYYSAFMNGESFRMSCYYCQYSTKDRVSDITMGDCDSVDAYKLFYPHESKSIVLLNTQKGIDVWNKVADGFHAIGLDYSVEIKANQALRNPCSLPSKRSVIYNDLKALSWDDFTKKYKSSVKFSARFKVFVWKALFK